MKPMTAEEVAEMMRDELAAMRSTDATVGAVINYIAINLKAYANQVAEERVKEANDLNRREIDLAHKLVDGMQGVSSHIGDVINEAKQEGYAKGVEDAAKIASGELDGGACPDENYGDNCHESIARRIRALLKPGEGGAND